jgi:LCP family protein required for cell wall assembly
LGDAITPATGSAVNYLIVGSDSRDGIEDDTANVGAIGTATEVKGRRSDTIIVLRVDGNKAEMMSIPRDLWVRNVKTGKDGRINGTYSQGPDNLVRSVTANLGIPINRYIEVDFVSFAGMVDAVGGIDIDFPHAVIDTNSGLKIATPGTHKLDGTMALAYVRSRHYTESIDGKAVLEPTADLGRQVRQQNFIRTVLKAVGDSRNPLTLAKVGGAAAKGVRVDSEVGFFDLVKLARQLGGADPETKVLPTVGANKGGASVLELKNAEALPILAEFGATG